MMDVILSPQARADLEEILDYIAADDPSAADRVHQEVEELLERLGEMPELARIREDLAPGKALRFLPVHSYLIVYRLADQRLEVVRVLSARRDLPDLLV